MKTEPGSIGRKYKKETVVDEICRCGHSIRDHAPLLFSDVGAHYTKGKGACRKCHDCARFTWKRFVMEKK